MLPRAPSGILDTLTSFGCPNYFLSCPLSLTLLYLFCPSVRMKV